MEEQRLLKRKRKAETEDNSTLLIAACADLAALYVKEGRHNLAIEEYKILAKIYKSENKLIEYAKAFRGIGEAYMGLQDFEKALEHQTVYLNVANEETNKLEQQRALATIGHTYLTWFLETQTDPDKKKLNAAYKYFMKSLMIAESLNGINKLERVDMLARLFSNLGLVKESLEDYNKALELLNRSITICKQHDIYEQLSRGYISIASLYEKRGEYNEAIRHYNLAIDSAKKLKDKVDLTCAALIAKSETLIKLADFHSAKQVLLKAFKLKTPNIRERNVIERHLRIVAALCYTEDKLVVTCNNQRELKKLYEKMGDGACNLKNYSKAIEYYKLMLEYAEKSGVSGRDLASCYYSLAETYKDNNQFIEAIDYFEKEYALCNDLKDSLNTLSKIADTKEAAGAPVNEVKAVYERAFSNCRNKSNLKEERRMVSRCIAYLRRNSSHTDAFQLDQYLNTLDQPSFEDELSSSDDESEDSEAKGNIGDDINLNDITDNSDNSDNENQQSTKKEDTIIGRRRAKNLVIKKNPKGESQLHVACINGSMPVVRHLVEIGHPINVRDHSGWLPLHEACNHGHFEIVKLLLDKGAAINDRGGIHCNGITPLYDAANNGHLKIVKLLLDNGASAICKTDDGDTPLNVLKEWQKKNPFHGDDLDLFQSLIRRMSEAMEKAGQNSKSTHLVRVSSYSQKSDKENVQRSTRQEQLSRSLGLNDNDSDDSSGQDSSSHSSEGDEANEYLKVMGTLRNKTKNISTGIKHSHLVTKRPALIITEEDNNDWLEDDMQNTKAAKKRKTNSASSLMTMSVQSKSGNSEMKKQTSPKKRTSFEVSDNFFVDNFEDECILVEDRINSIEEQRRASNESRLSTESTSSTSSVKRKTQVSLLDAGFSRSRSDTPFDKNYSSGSTSEKYRRSSFNRVNSFNHRSKPQQQKLANFGHTRSVVEADSNTVMSTQAMVANVNEQIKSLTPSIEDLMVYVDVKIEGKVFRVPVLLSQVQTNTIGWLSEQAANKYARKECTKPTLELETDTGALLSDEDPLSLLFPLGATQAEPVVGRVVKLSLPPLVERYKEACSLMSTDTDSLICNLLEELSISLNLANNGFFGKSLAPLCKALNYQNSLLELDLSGNFIDSDCIIKLCSSLPTLANLCTLNLRCTGLVSSHLTEFVKVFTSTSAPILQKLSNLNLSDNFLKDKSLSHLSQITRHLRLSKLNLSNVRFTGNIFKETSNENICLNFSEMQCLDLSDNELGVNDIKKFISWLSASKLCVLNVSRNDTRNEGILRALVDSFENDGGKLDLRNLDLSRCNVQENELYDLLRLCSTEKSLLSEINLSYNPNLTGISLRRLLECSTLRNMNLIGCDNILRYFDNMIACDFFENSNDNEEKILKISANLRDYPAQVATLVEMFKSKYCDCYIEKTEKFLFLASTSEKK